MPGHPSTSALALLVTRVALADHHDAAVAADDLAVVADGLDGGVDLHDFLFRCLRRARASFRTRAGRYFSTGLAVAVDDAAAGEVVGAELHDHAVFGDDADVVLPHLAGDRGEDLVPVAQLHAEHRVGQRLGDHAFDLDDAVFLRHTLAIAVLQTGRSAVDGVSVPGHADKGATHQRASIRDIGCLGNLVRRATSTAGRKPTRGVRPHSLRTHARCGLGDRVWVRRSGWRGDVEARETLSERL